LDSPIPSRPCWVEISTRAFEKNFRFLKTLAPPRAELLAIVKANAYGHSLTLCAPAAVRAGARWLGVTSVEEALAARKLSPEAHIVVMGGVFPGQEAAVVEYDLTPMLWEPFQLDAVANAARAAGSAPGSLGVFLEIDSGMSRQGVAPEKLDSILPCFGPQSPLRMDAVTTHLYASDERNGLSTTAQLTRLEQALTRISASESPEWLSVGASAALLGNDASQVAALAERFGLKLMLRPGLALYGVVPRFEPSFGTGEEPEALAAARRNLQPILAWKTRVVSVREVPPGTEIGYNGTFVATEPMRLALIAAGYADGLDRRLGNRLSLLVRGRRAPLVGRISMDQAVLDVTDFPDVEPGDEVVILGAQGTETVSAFDHADAGGTIPWEVFTRIGQRVRRMGL
jgi:alanine racemase